MRQLSFILIIIFLACLQSRGQSIAEEGIQHIKELRTQIQQSKDDTNKADLFSDLVHYLEGADSFDAMLATANEEYNLAVKLNYTFGTAKALWSFASYYNSCKKDHVTASNYLKKANEIIEHYPYELDPRIEILETFSILNHFFTVGDFTYAMRIVTRRLSLYEQVKNKPMIAHYNSLIGFIYLREGRISDAKRYYQVVLQAEKELNDGGLIADAYNCMADVYVEEKKYDSALANNFSALNVYQTLAIGYQALISRSVPRKERCAYTSYKIGNIYKLTHDYTKALGYTLFAIRSNDNGNIYDVAAYYLNAGDIYREMGNYSMALKYLDTGLAISKEINHSENIRDAYYYYGQTFFAQKKYDSAYRYNLLYYKLKDSITNVKTSSEIEQVHTAYEVDKKDNQILLLNQQNKLREAVIAKQNLTRNIIIGAAVLIAFVIVLLYNRRQLQQKNKFQTELNRQRNELFNAVITTQEKERKRIAQDLHDSLGSVLSAAKLKLSELEDTSLFAGMQKEKYSAALSLLDEAATELRNISHNIMPATLAKIGLVAALQSVFDSISSYSGLQISFSVYDMDSRLNEETEVSIYRIVLELVNNVVKHAKATEVMVQLVRHPSYINITIEDNGMGFNYEQMIQKAKGIGLSNIVSRVDYLHGTIEFDSGSGSGTTVIMNIPYTNIMV